MCLINERVCGFRRRRVLPDVRFRFPDLGAEDFGGLVLHHAAAIGGDALIGTGRPYHPELVELAVLQGEVGKLQLPVAVAEGLEGEVGLDLPSGEIAVEIDGGGVGGFLAEHPAVVGAVKTVVEMGVGDFGERVIAVGELQLAQGGPLHAALKCCTVRLQPRIVRRKFGLRARSDVLLTLA